MRICASRACGQDHGCSSETAPRATRSSALSGHTCVMGREAAVPQIGGLVPPRETGGRALLPRGSRPARPARIPPAPVPGSRPPVGSSRLSLWDETTLIPIHYATSRKSFENSSRSSDRNVWEAAVPQIGGLVPPRETGGRALLPRGSRPARPARIPPAPVPGSRPPVGSSRLSLWDETTPLPIHYATSRKSSKEFRIPSADTAGGTLARTRASAWSSRRGWLPWEIRERMEKSRDERRSHASLPVEAHPRPATDG